MWQAIREALRAISRALKSTTSAFAWGLCETGDWFVERWNAWARLMSGTAYRPEPVNDLRDEVTEMTALPEAPAPARDDQTELGRRVRLAARAILDGATEAPADLPGEIQVWLVARSLYDLTLVVRATDVEVGRHLNGEATLRGPHGSEVPGIDVRRDERIVMSRIEAETRRVVDEHERRRIVEMFAVRAPVVKIEEPSPVASPGPLALSPAY